MAFAVLATPIAHVAIDALRGKARQSFERKREELAARGCLAAGYRLTGEGLGRACAVRLADDYRLVTVFPDPQRVLIVLVARHNEEESDVYRLLYELLELEAPTEPREKLPCCDDQHDPPVDENATDSFLAASKGVVERLRRADRLRRTRRSR